MAIPPSEDLRPAHLLLDPTNPLSALTAIDQSQLTAAPPLFPVVATFHQKIVTLIVPAVTTRTIKVDYGLQDLLNVSILDRRELRFLVPVILTKSTENQAGGNMGFTRLSRTITAINTNKESISGLVFSGPAAYSTFSLHIEIDINNPTAVDSTSFTVTIQTVILAFDAPLSGSAGNLINLTSGGGAAGITPGSGGTGSPDTGFDPTNVGRGDPRGGAWSPGDNVIIV